MKTDDEGIVYKVKIKGAKDGTVKKAIKETAMTVTMRRRPPSTVGQLRHRMEKDITRIETILESRGYYDGKVTMDLDVEESPPRVYIRVDQGEQYRFRNVELRFSGEPDELLQKIKPMVRRKNRVVAANVFGEQQRILDLMKRRGYPFPKLARRTIAVDRENKKVDLLLEFDPGLLAYFGPVVVEGLESLEPKYIHRQVPWREGRRYDDKDVHDFETKLLGSGLFGSARVSPQQPSAETNAIPIRVAVNERDQRTIRLGVNYSDIGPGGRIYWEHRNVFGGGERLESSLGWNPIETELEGKLTRSGFLDANQSLVLDITATIETPDAYDAEKVRAGGMVLRDFTAKIQGGLGLGYSFSKVEQFDLVDRYAYVLFPLQAVFDYRDDRLNPMRGHQLFGRSTWFEDTHGNDSFLKTYLEGRDYFLLWDKYRLSSALRLTLGSIDGGAIDSVPADERYYAGGGGSIRGYEYQAVGPKLDGTPTGGDKLLEFSAELRMQPGNRLGYVVFIDGGTVYNDLLHDENRSLRYGAGIGLRWFTTIGPLRADMAYPLNADDSQVERVQFYISLGQAF
ncbi:Translocation and assembly module TamA [Pontiella desulfatans]|uniref:Translocation and assembly module TamA n=1 Tax=Pontiella desulfatans TaxID=2750659 RepID=A0A6C2TWM0_PONDE|nr:BamA/TamA family outer membrane protein [Pontiella desulfatans]VGO11932.1 Translocation and assembly module TamA [Pontiella desulfatans]